LSTTTTTPGDDAANTHVLSTDARVALPVREPLPLHSVLVVRKMHRIDHEMREQGVDLTVGGASALVVTYILRLYFLCTLHMTNHVRFIITCHCLCC
jgi:hypothetical protein